MQNLWQDMNLRGNGKRERTGGFGMWHSAFWVIFLCLAVFLGMGGVTNAKPVYDPNAARFSNSNIDPILPDVPLNDTPKDVIPNEIATKLYDRCLSKMPPRFTPDGLQYFCTCTAAAIQGNLRMSELREIQNKRNWKLGNKAFEKYIHTSVIPCLDMPVNDMEYMDCVLYRGMDIRVSRVPLYCRCVSAAMSDHFTQFGETEMMTEWGDPGKRYDSPLTALWESESYNRNKDLIGEKCLASYLSDYPFTGK